MVNVIFQPVAYLVAECVALWGEPEQEVAWKREEQQSGWLLLLHLCNRHRQRCACGVYSHSLAWPHLSGVWLPQQLHENHTLLYLFFWAYLVCVLFPQSAVSAARHALSHFDSMFPFLLRRLWGPSQVTLRTQWCHIDDPQSFILRTRWFHITYPLGLRWEHDCETADK